MKINIFTLPTQMFEKSSLTKKYMEPSHGVLLPKSSTAYQYPLTRDQNDLTDNNGQKQLQKLYRYSKQYSITDLNNILTADPSYNYGNFSVPSQTVDFHMYVRHTIWMYLCLICTTTCTP